MIKGNWQYSLFGFCPSCVF